jgi:hypothetical protein
MALRRLMTCAAALAMFGCSSDTEQSSTAPLSAFENPGRAETADPQGNPEQAPGDGSPAASAEGPSTSQSEGQGSGEVSLEPSEQTTSSSGEVTPVETAPSTEPPAAVEPTPPVVEPTPSVEPPVEEPVVEEPVVEEPPPIVRPALNCGAPAPALTGGVESCAVNGQGNVAGQDWFLWYNGNGGGCMTAYDNLSGAFSAEWNNPGDFLARIGHWFDETQTFAQIGEIGADFSFTRQGSAGGFNFIGIYGWTVGTLVEYYIVEDNFANGAVQPFNTQLRGNFTVDGAQYNVYTGNRVNQPAITGANANFTQVFSVRQNRRQCGHISISQHFRQWQSMGINLGMAKEAKIVVESGGGNGSITFTHANVSITPPN